MDRESLIKVSGLLRVKLAVDDPDAVVIVADEHDPKAWKREDDTGLWRNDTTRQHNAFVNQGLVAILRRYFNIATVPAAPSHITLSSDNLAVTATTTSFGGTISAKAFTGGTPTIAGNTVTVGADFVKADVAFSIRKVGISNAAADANAQDIIGGAGVSPYNESFTIDLTTTTAFDLRPEIDVTLTAV